MPTYLDGDGQIVRNYGYTIWEETPQVGNYVEDRDNGDSYRLPPTDSDAVNAQTAAINDVPGLPATALGVLPGSSGITFTVDYYSEGGGGLLDEPPHHTVLYATARRSPVPIAVRAVAGVADDGQLYASPDDLPWPDDAIGWEWEDGTTGTDRATTLTSLRATFQSSSAVPYDTTADPDREVTIPSALIVQNTAITWETGGDGRATLLGDWTPNTSAGARELITGPDQVMTVDILDDLDEEGRVVVWARTPAPGYSPEPPDLPGGVPDSRYDAGWTIFQDPEVEWTFTLPPFRWVMPDTEEVAEDWFDYGTQPPLRQYPRTDGLATSSARRIWPAARSVQRSNRVGGSHYR